MPKPRTRTRPSTVEKPSFNLQTFLPFRIVVLAESITRAFAAVYDAEFGLSIFEGRIIAVIGNQGHLTTQEIIERTQLDRVRVSRAVIRLSDKKLIARSNKPGDQRAQILDLTPAGRQIYQRLVPVALAIKETLTAELTAQQEAQLDLLLGKLVRGVREAGTQAPTPAA